MLHNKVSMQSKTESSQAKNYHQFCFDRWGIHIGCEPHPSDVVNINTETQNSLPAKKEILSVSKTKYRV
jgi:hypothetical protein